LLAVSQFVDPVRDIGVKLLVADSSTLHEICLATHALKQGLGKGTVAPFVLFDCFLVAG
jgi:hypothetical protein